VVCTNLLEHVVDPGPIASALAQMLPVGGHLLVSGPRSYPWHADPFDTMFRPDVAELAAIFPATEVVAGEVVPSGTYWDWLGRSPLKLAGALVQLLVPFYPRTWWSNLNKLRWLRRPFTATCVLLRRR
jgi:hypothetical protein